MPRPSTGANLSVAQLQQILEDRKTDLNKLAKQRKEAQRKLDLIDREIERIGGDGSGGYRRSGTRVRNDRSLPETLELVMREAGKAMRVGEIADAVLATGYRSNSANFRAIINQTLIKERKRFMSSGERGTYQLKKAEK